MDEPIGILQRFGNASQWLGAHFFGFVSCSRSEAERRLGSRLPQAYVDLVGQLQERGIPCRDILEAGAVLAVPSWPSYLVPFFHDGSGNAYCFDTRSSAEGEYPVVFLDHELGRDARLSRLGHTDGSFAEWLTRYACEEIPDTAPVTVGRTFGIGCLIAIVIGIVLAGVGLYTMIGWIRQVL